MAPRLAVAALIAVRILAGELVPRVSVAVAVDPHAAVTVVAVPPPAVTFVAAVALVDFAEVRLETVETLVCSSWDIEPDLVEAPAVVAARKETVLPSVCRLHLIQVPVVRLSVVAWIVEFGCRPLVTEEDGAVGASFAVRPAADRVTGALARILAAFPWWRTSSRAGVDFKVRRHQRLVAVVPLALEV